MLPVLNVELSVLLAEGVPAFSPEGRGPLGPPIDVHKLPRSEITVNRNKETITPETNDRTTAAPNAIQQQIRHRAYELYEQRGGEAGRELDDWLQAEAEATRSMEKRGA